MPRGRAKKPKQKLKTARPNRQVPINFKCTEAEKKAMERNAREFANNNLSLWIRHSSIKHRPDPQDLVPA